MKKIICLFLLILFSLDVCGAPLDDSYDGIIHGYHFDEVEGNLSDFVGGGDGIPNNVTYDQKTVSNLLGSAYDLNVDLSRINFDNGVDDLQLQTFSFVGWVKPNDIETQYVLLAMNTSFGYDGGYHILASASSGRLRYYEQGSYDWIGSNMPQDLWYHLGVTRYNESGICSMLYCLNGSCSSDSCPSGAELIYKDKGLSFGPPNENYNGSLDEWYFFDRNLSAGEIQDIYLGGLPSYAGCGVGFDYCVNISLGYGNISGTIGIGCHPECKSYGLSSIQGLENIEGQQYVWANCSNVYARVTNSSNITHGATYNLWRFGNAIDNGLCSFLVNRETCLTGCADIESKPYLQICLKGESTLYWTGGLTTQPDTGSNSDVDLVIDDFTSYYRRNWTFKQEYGTSLFDFSDYEATLTVLCDNYGSFEYDLDTYLEGDSLTVQTLERPRFRLYLKTTHNESDPNSFYATEHIREDTEHFLKGDYFVKNDSLMFTFKLLDYTTQCDNIIKFSRLVGSDEQIIWASDFDNDRNVFPYLQNSTEYRVKVFCLDGSVRDLGYIKTLTQLSRDIEVTHINLGNTQTVYSGGLRIGNITADYDSEIIYLPYLKDEGYISNITICLYNLTTAPMSSIYCSSETQVSGGSFSFDTEDRTKEYYISVYVENDGQIITNAKTVSFSDESSDPYVDKGCKICPLPDEVMGVTDTIIYKALGLLGMVVLGLGFARIDGGYAVVAVVGWELLMDMIGWHDVPDWLLISATLLALGLLWGMMRRHDE